MKTVKYLAISISLLLFMGLNPMHRRLLRQSGKQVKADNPNAAEITFENEMT